MTSKELARLSGMTPGSIDTRRRKCPNATDEELILPIEEFNKVAKKKGSKKTYTTEEGIELSVEDVISITGANKNRIMNIMTRLKNRGVALEKDDFIELFRKKDSHNNPLPEAVFINEDYTLSEIVEWFSMFGSSPEWKKVLTDMCRARHPSQIRPLIEYLEKRRQYASKNC